MSLVIVQHQLSSYTLASSTQTVTSTPTLGNILVAITMQVAVSSAETISDNQGTPNTWTKQCSAVTNADNMVSIWTAPVVHTAAGFALSYSSMGIVATPGYIEIIEVSGQHATVPIDGTPGATNNANGALTALSQSVGTAASANDLGIFAIVANSNEAITWTSPLALIEGINASNGNWVGQGIFSSAGAITLAATMSASTKVAVAGIIIQPSAPPVFTLMGGMSL